MNPLPLARVLADAGGELRGDLPPEIGIDGW